MSHRVVIVRAGGDGQGKASEQSTPVRAEHGCGEGSAQALLGAAFPPPGEFAAEVVLRDGIDGEHARGDDDGALPGICRTLRDAGVRYAMRRGSAAHMSPARPRLAAAPVLHRVAMPGIDFMGRRAGRKARV